MYSSVYPSGFPDGSVVNNPPIMQEMQETWVWSWVSGRCSGGGHGNPLQYSCLENPLDRASWWAQSIGLHKELDMTEVAEHAHMHGMSLYQDRVWMLPLNPRFGARLLTWTIDLLVGIYLNNHSLLPGWDTPISLGFLVGFFFPPGFPSLRFPCNSLLVHPLATWLVACSALPSSLTD